MRSLWLAAALMTSLPAWAETTVHKLTWDVTVDGTSIGQRKATVTVETQGAQTLRTFESWTELDAKAGAVGWSWRQRLTFFADDGPAAFHSVMKEDGSPREVQGRLAGAGWTVTLADRAMARTFDAPAQRIDLSTADLLDPYSSVPLRSFETARMLSAETGDVWEGTVADLGTRSATIDGTALTLHGWSWTTPEGTSSFWYDADGWLVRFETRVLGRAVKGTLTDPPPRSADAFTVQVDAGGVESSDL